MNDKDPIHYKLRKKIDELEKSVHKIFPHYGNVQIFGTGDGKHKINNVQVEHVDSNWRYKDSKYYYFNKKNLFIIQLLII